MVQDPAAASVRLTKDGTVMMHPNTGVEGVPFTFYARKSCFAKCWYSNTGTCTCDLPSFERHAAEIGRVMSAVITGGPSS